MLGFIAAPAQRPTLLGYTGATYGIAAVLGPLVGGALTERASWRYCFYINVSAPQETLHFMSITRLTLLQLPIGGLAAVIVFFFFKTPSHVKPAEATFKEKMLQLDLVGAALIMALIIMYTLALQYGGQIHPWKSSVVIGLLVGAFLVFLVFVAWEIYQKERAMIVRRLVSILRYPAFPSRTRLTIFCITVLEAVYLGRRHLHVLFRWCLLQCSLLSSDLLPECLQH